MIYSLLIDELAKIDLAALVREVDEQRTPGELLCYCPFCKGEIVNDGQQAQKVKNAHFVIFENQKGGLYGTAVCKWQCLKTKRTGYGALELYAAMKGLTLEGENLRKACLGLLQKIGYTDAMVADKYPELLVRDYRTQEERDVKTFLLQPRAEFTPQELMSLGCTVRTTAKGEIEYGFDSKIKDGWHFSTDQINTDFRIYSLARCTLPSVLRNGKVVAETIYGNPWNPLFVCFTDDNLDGGCVFRPATDQQPIVFSNSEDHTPQKISRWLAGDAVFMYATEHRDSSSTAVMAAIKKYDPDECTREYEQVWEPTLDEKGKEKMELVDKEIPEPERKAKNVIYCTSPQDAVSTYYHLKALHHTYKNNTQWQETLWYHVAFTYGKVDFSSVHYKKLSRFADKILTLFPNDIMSERTARAIGRRYRDIYRAALPHTFRQKAYQRVGWVYQHPVHTVRDFFVAYQMTKEQSYQFDNDVNKLFRTVVSTALTSNPIERKEKRDNRTGKLRETYYVVDPATVWEFMAGEGYYRDIDPESEDKIGHFVHLDGPFVETMDVKSVVAMTQACLDGYARQIANAGTDDYRLMKQGIARDTKEVNEKTVSSLPAIEVNYKGGYGRQLDHFYFRNGALRITPDSIELIPYSKVDFHIDRNAVMDFNIALPQTMPFAMAERKEYTDRLAEIQQMQQDRDENGNPVYTVHQISTAKRDLMQWAQTHRWHIDWQGRREADMWPTLRVLRGFANMSWQMEEDLIRSGNSLSQQEQDMLDGHFANLMFDCGRALWRFRESKSNCIPYLLENSVADNQSAQGGSGKSSLVNVFLGCCGKVLPINCKDIQPGKDLSLYLAQYRPNVHRIVHWEDWEKGMSLKMLYNYGTSGFSFRRMFTDATTVSISEGPGHIVSSNYPLSDTDESTLRRFNMGAFSNRFCGENAMLNKPARMISDLMPDFSSAGIDTLRPQTRSQIVLIMALAVQFVMRYDTIVSAPMEKIAERTLEKELTKAFVRWAQMFFSQKEVYGVPVDIDSCMDDFKYNYSDVAEDRQQKFSRKVFRERLSKYCEYIHVRINPEHLLENKADLSTGYFHLTTWRTIPYFTEKQWEGLRHHVKPKYIREIDRSDHVCFFYREDDKVPASYKELKEIATAYAKAPDPLPIRDENGDVVTLTAEEVSALEIGPRFFTNGVRPQAVEPQVQEVKVNDADMPF